MQPFGGREPDCHAGGLLRGFAFEHDLQRPAEWGCGYEYRAVSAADPFDLWRPGERQAVWDDVGLDHGLSAAAIWWALRTRRATTPIGPTTAVPATLLKARLTSPRPLTLGQLKALADGAVAAAQWTTRADPVGIDRLTGNLVRAGIEVDRDHVVGLLEDPAGASAGQCGDRLIANDGRVDPDDHLLVPGAVSVELSAASRTSLNAALFGARPLPSSERQFVRRMETVRWAHRLTLQLA